MDEFRIIDTIFKPLAKDGAPSFGLENDTAIYTPPAGFDLVVTKDAMIEGVHFPEGTRGGVVATRLLRANLSDLAASGAKPVGYLLALMGERKLPETWLKDFASALKADQKKFGLDLFGGDTTSGAKSLCLSLTALGLVETGRGLTRIRAQPGDLVCVSGTIGDAHLGLKCLKGALPHDNDLVSRFEMPEPRIALGRELIGVATAAIDVSDGLLGDVNHICDASGVGAALKIDKVPLSETASKYVRNDTRKIVELATAGDDFELIFTIPEKARTKIPALAGKTGLPITVIGEITEKSGLTVLDAKDAALNLNSLGYTHFTDCV